MSLYKAETRRLVKRRFTKFLVIGALLVLAAVAVGMFFTNEKVGPDQIAAAQREADADYERTVQQVTLDKQNCEKAKGTADAANWPPDCSQITPPAREEIQTSWFLPPTFDFRENFGALITAMAAILAMAAFVIGASFVGAEWNSGGMMNLLLWRPQRVKVLSTKLVAFLANLTLLTVLVTAAWTGIFVLIARLRGTIASMTAGAWESFALTGLRALALVLVAGALGFGLASIGRHTAMALGVAVGVAVIFQFGLGAVLAIAQVKFFEAYLIPVWIQAWMDKTYTVTDYQSCDYSVSSNGCEPDTMDITWQMSGVALAVALVVVVGAALWTMRRRDIT